MPTNANVNLSEEEIADVAAQANAHSSRTEKVSVVIERIKAIAVGDVDHLRSSAIHIIHSSLGIGPHSDVLEQLEEAFPRC